MSTFQPTAAYYRITWNLSSPTDYTGSGTTAGGINPYNSRQYHSMIALTGTAANPTMTDGDEVLLNGYVIGPFLSTDTVATIIQRFNDMSPWTKVQASQDIASTYVTLSCAYSDVQTSIVLSNRSGTPLTALGFTAGGFSLYNPIYGSTFSGPGNGETITLNGVTITFATGALTVAGVCNTINASTGATNVVATPYANKIQLNSISGSPILFGSDTGSAASDIGFAANTSYAGAMTYADAVEVEQGYLRWKLIASTIGSICTPVYYQSVAMTGTGVTNGVAPPATLSWTLGVEHIDDLRTLTVAGEPETVGTELVGAAAVKRQIARALVNSITENCNVYNANIAIGGSSVVSYNTSQMVIESVTASAIDAVADVDDVEGNLTVTMVSNV
jgi:hypothetical protein